MKGSWWPVVLLTPFTMRPVVQVVGCIPYHVGRSWVRFVGTHVLKNNSIGKLPRKGEESLAEYIELTFNVDARVGWTNAPTAR